jgi:hypothetical protein
MKLAVFFSAAALTAVALLNVPARAQVGIANPSPGTQMMTPGAQTMQTPNLALPMRRSGAGIGLGATELSVPGVSPMSTDGTGTAPLGLQVTACSGVSGFVPSAPPASAMSTTDVVTPNATPGFDGGGVSGTALSPCATIGNAPGGILATNGGSPVAANGGSGIPLGATQIGSGGVSPLPSLAVPFAQTPSSASAMMQPPAMAAPSGPIQSAMPAAPCPGGIILPGMPGTLSDTTLSVAGAVAPTSC